MEVVGLGQSCCRETVVYLGLILPLPRELWSQLFGGFTLEG